MLSEMAKKRDLWGLAFFISIVGVLFLDYFFYDLFFTSQTFRFPIDFSISFLMAVSFFVVRRLMVYEKKTKSNLSKPQLIFFLISVILVTLIDNYLINIILFSTIRIILDFILFIPLYGFLLLFYKKFFK
jgi:hypothetical protein